MTHCPHCGHHLRGAGQPHAAILAACDDYGVPARLVLSASREARVALVRAIAAHLLRVEEGMSYAQIGAILRRDHTTIVAACKRVAARVASEPLFALRVRRIAEDYREGRVAA